jgi:hypothetical protein
MWQLTRDFYEKDQLILNLYKRLQGIARHGYVQLELYYGVYNFYVLKKFGEGKKLLRIFLLNGENSNLNKVFFNNYISSNNRLCVVKISSEKESYHKITYISPECQHLLGFSHTKLLAKDLNTILP